MLSGAGKTKSKPKLRPNALEYIPMATNAVSNPTNNIIKQFESLSLNNGSRSFMASMTSEFLRMRQKMEKSVALDCEMVGVGVGSESALAHVAIVGFNGNILLNKYVIPVGGINSITNYRSAFSGITKEKLEPLNKDKFAFEKIKKDVYRILKNKIIVGHGLINDFNVLGFIPNPANVWDSTEMDIYKQDHQFREGLRQPRKLKVISKEFTGNNIQKNNGKGHSPVEDARASMNLYRVSLGYPKVEYTNMAK